MVDVAPDLTELRDSKNKIVVFFTGLGANPETMQFVLKNTSGVVQDVTGLTIKVKLIDNFTDQTELFNLTATIDDGPNGLYSIALSAVNLTDAQIRPDAVLINHQDAGAGILRVLFRNKVPIVDSGLN